MKQAVQVIISHRLSWHLHTLTVFVIVYFLAISGSDLTTASAGVIVGTRQANTGDRDHLVMFLQISEMHPDGQPYTMNLVTGELRPITGYSGVAPSPLAPLVYDAAHERLLFVEKSGRFLGKLGLSDSPPLGHVVDLVGPDTCFIGSTIPGGENSFTTFYSRLYVGESLLVMREPTSDGALKDVYLPILSSGITHLGCAPATGLTYCIISSFFRFPVAGVGTPDSVWVASPTHPDSIPIIVHRPLTNLIVADSLGKVQTSKPLKPVMYQGFDVSPDGKVCALSEPVQLDSTRLSARLVLQSLTSSSVTSAEIASKYGVVHPRFSPDGSKLAAIGYEPGKGAVVLISTAPLYVDFEILREYLDGGPTGFTWSPDSNLLMVSVKSGSTDAAAQRWEIIDVQDGVTVSVLQPKFPGEAGFVLLPDFQRFVWVR